MAQMNSETCCISSAFKKRDRVQSTIDALFDRGLDRDSISVVGKNYQTESRITGFLTRKDVILDGLKSGAIFGSLFGSFLGLLSGVGVLFIPFVGSVVAAGPLGGALLGGASGAIAGSAGAGLVSALVALGMPEEKAAIYQTRLAAGEFLLVVEVPCDRTEEFQNLLENNGAEEVFACRDMSIPRQPEGRLESAEQLSPEIRSHLSPEAQQTFFEAYNEAWEDTGNGTLASARAWEKIEQEYDRDEHGYRSQSKRQKVGV